MVSVKQAGQRVEALQAEHGELVIRVAGLQTAQTENAAVLASARAAVGRQGDGDALAALEAVEQQAGQLERDVLAARAALAAVDSELSDARAVLANAEAEAARKRLADLRTEAGQVADGIDAALLTVFQGVERLAELRLAVSWTRVFVPAPDSALVEVVEAHTTRPYLQSENGGIPYTMRHRLGLG